jgi:tetratricopeptide (TPR) repeat protein
MFPFRNPAARLLISLLVLVSATCPAIACLWDYDTLRDERRGLPGIAEVLAGKWEKHSQFFYEQRVLKMKALIDKEPGNLPAYDNLAVAYEKLGNRDSAIAIMDRKEHLKPGEYTTYANVGTFYLHKGDFDNGILYIRKALQVNPNAHFGREEYQLRLAEFLRDGKLEPKLLRGTDFLLVRHGAILTPDEARRLAETGLTDQDRIYATSEPSSTQPLDPDEQSETDVNQLGYYRGSPARFGEPGFKENVFDGIVGMIRFGTGTSAELYLTLGDLLVLRGDKNLAFRAYQRALDLGHPRQAYLKAAMKTVSELIYDKSSIQPEAIAAERVDADAWVSAYQNYEDQLLRDGRDVDDDGNYAEFYRKFGRAELPQPFSVADYTNPKNYDMMLLVGVISLFVVPVSIFAATKLGVRRRHKAKPAPASG